MNRAGWPTVVLLFVIAGLALMWLRPREDAAAPELAPERPLDSAEERSKAPEPPADVGDPGGRAPALEPGAPEREAALPPVTADDPVQHVVYGTVLDETAAPVAASVRVWLSFVDALGERLRVECGGDGRYSIAGLAPGEWWVSVRARGFRDVNARLELDRARPTVRRDFFLARQDQVRVKVVTPDGRPFFEALGALDPPLSFVEIVPVATRGAPGELLLEVRGSHNNPFGVGQFWQSGAWSEPLPPEYMGVVFLFEPRPVYVSLVDYHFVLASERVEPGAEEVVFAIDPESLRGNRAGLTFQVVDGETGEPLAGASAMLSGGATFHTGMMATSDEEGRFAFADQNPGRIGLQISADGYAMHLAEVDLPPGRETDLGAVRLARATAIAGQVVDASGAGVGCGLLLRRLDRDETGRFAMRRGSPSAGADGRFRIDGLEPGEYALRAGGGDGELASELVVVDTRSGAAEGVRLVARPARRLVLRPPASGWRGIRYRVLDARGRRVIAGRFWDAPPRPVWVAPGPHVVEILGPDGELVERREE